MKLDFMFKKISILWVLLVAFLLLFVQSDIKAVALDSNLGLSHSGGRYESNQGVITYSASGTNASAASGTLTITNNHTTKAVLSFMINATVTGGSRKSTSKLQVFSTDVKSVTGSNFSTNTESYNATHSIELDAGASVTVVLDASARNGSVSVTITKITLTPKIVSSVKLKAHDSISYSATYYATVNATEQTTTSVTNKDASISFDKARGIVITASGYAFVGADYTFGNISGYLCALNGSITPDTNYELTPYFVSTEGTAPFQIGSNYYWTWETAMYATGGTSKVFLSANYTLPSTYAANGLSGAGTYITGNDGALVYSVPAGVTLVVPYSETDDGSRTQTGTSTTTKSAFRTLSAPAGVTINVSGTLLLNSIQGIYNTAHQGSIAGNYGALDLDGKIHVLSGGDLNARGIIYGEGRITTASGATVHQYLEVTDWRGGTAANGLRENFLSSKFQTFPLNIFTFQNIQVSTSYVVGSKLVAYYYLYASGAGIADEITLMGPSSNDGVLFVLDTNGTRVVDGVEEPCCVVLDYEKGDADNLQAKTIVDIYGKVKVESFTMSIKVLLTISINSADYVCPLSGAFDVSIKAGGDFEVSKSFKILPGMKIVVEELGAMTITSTGALYLYDYTDYLWDVSETGSYTYLDYRRLPMTVGKTDVYAKNTEDASLIVNGTLTINGAIYCSSGARTHSSSIKTTSSTGKITIASGISTADVSIKEALYKSDATTSVVSVDFTFAKGHLATCPCSTDRGVCKCDYTCEECQWSLFASGTTYYSNGTTWYTHKTEFVHNGEQYDVFYGVGGYNTDAKINEILALDVDNTICEYIGGYTCSHWHGKVNAATETTPPTTLYTRNVSLNSKDFVLDYRLDNYIWMNASINIPAEGDVELVDTYGGTLKLVEGSGGTYYLVRKVLSTELTTTFTVTLAINGIKTDVYNVSFSELKSAIEAPVPSDYEGGETDEAYIEALAKYNKTINLIDAMLEYGKAAVKYFDPKNATNITLSAAPSDFYGGFTEQTIATAYGTLNSFNNIVMHTTGATFSFNERLSMLVRINAAGLTEADIAQIGLLVSDSDAELRANGADGVTAYILYDPDYKKPSGTNPNKPDKSGYTEDWSNLVSFSELDLSQMIISFDLESVDYQSRFNIRPYIVTTDGTVIYGEQYCYGLGDYIYRNYNKGYGADFQNFLYYTWVYAEKALEAFS